MAFFSSEQKGLVETSLLRLEKAKASYVLPYEAFAWANNLYLLKLLNFPLNK